MRFMEVNEVKISQKKKVEEKLLELFQNLLLLKK